MTILDSFQSFENTIRTVLHEANSDKEIVDRLQPHFQSFITLDGLVPQKYKSPKGDKYSQYLLYKPGDEVFSIVAFIWGPGQSAPIHDHLTWGLVGVYEGAIEETRYKNVKSKEKENGFELEVINTVIAKKHDISFVYPPNADIHSVRNPFKETAVTIHLYGTDIGKQNRHSYQKEPYAINSIITPHDNQVPVYIK